jgi:phosphatidylinositol kinase/protein kinase (PI-3  family)
MQCRVLSSANYPILFGFTEHAPLHQSHLVGGSQHVDESLTSDGEEVGLRLLFPGGPKPSGSNAQASPAQPPRHDPHRFLLFKHDDDLRQDALVIQMFRMMNEVLVSCGLDLGMQFYDVLPTGPKEGFVEWLVGAVPLAVVISKYETPDEHQRRQGQDVRRPSTESTTDTSGCSGSDDGVTPKSASSVPVVPVSSVTSRLFPMVASPLDPVEVTIPTVPPAARSQSSSVRTFFRVHSADPAAAMDRFVKSCAGNSALTYLLGVGDRHLENILLRSSGTIIHCDFGFCFGRDPGHVLYRYV